MKNESIEKDTSHLNFGESSEMSYTQRASKYITLPYALLFYQN